MSVLCSMVRLLIWFIVTLSPLFRHYLTRTSLLVPNLFVLLYISSFLLLEQAICHSCYPYGNKIFPDFQLQIQVQEDPWSSWFIYLDTYRNNLYFTSIASLSKSIYRLSPLFLFYTYKMIRSLSSRFHSFRSRWHKEKEILSSKWENIWYLSVYIARQNLARVHSMKTSAEDR